MSSLPPGWTIAYAPLDTVRSAVDDILVQKIGSGPVYEIRFPGPAVFRLDFQEKIVLRQASPNLDEDLLGHYFGNNVLPRILDNEGELVIHAAGLATNDAALLLVAPSGAGKSTIAASLRQSGFGLLGDDAIIVSSEQGILQARAVYPSLRLYRDSIDSVLSGNGHWKPVAAGWSKLSATDLAESSRGIVPTTIVHLEPSHDAKITSRELAPAHSCIRLIEQCFMLDPADSDRLSDRFAQAAALARATRSYSLEFPHDFARVSEVADCILQLSGWRRQ